MTAPTVKVKPLVWGRYGVAMGGGAKYTCYKVRDGWDSVCYPFEGQQYSLAEGVSEQAAKAAAQADYERRILSAIDTTDLNALDRAKREARVEMFEQIWAAIERLHVKATAVDALNAIAPIIRALIEAERGKP